MVKPWGHAMRHDRTHGVHVVMESQMGRSMRAFGIGISHGMPHGYIHDACYDRGSPFRNLKWFLNYGAP